MRSYATKSTVFELDTMAGQTAYEENPGTLKIRFPFPDGVKEIEFESTLIHAPGFQVLNAKGKDVSSELRFPHHYKSKTRLRGKEMASLSLFSSGHFVLVSSDRKGNLNIAKLPSKLGSANEYIAFYDSDLTKRNPFECKIDHDEVAPSVKKTPGNLEIQADTNCRLTEIYWECDYDMFQKGGNTIQGALNQFEAMFNGTAILFEIENINIGVKAVKVWNTPDPYSYNTSFAALGDFQTAGNLANWPGQLAHLLSTRPLNLGGVAYLNALCTNFRYGFSNIDFTFSDLPAYSWTLSTIAHELGHNFSSNHTHNCNWETAPGVFSQIDSCWNAEGNCQPSIRGRVGTIMSYCHLTGSVNLALGFGPLPGNRIREAYADMPCVSGSIVIPNFTPANSGPFCVGDTVQLLSEDISGHSYLWTGPNGFTSIEKFPFINNVNQVVEGSYSLRIKRSACESRAKKTELVFNCMQVKPLPNAICAGSNLSIPFYSTGIFNPGNQFVVQLSNNAGSFQNPFLLDTLVSNSPGETINALLPTNLPLGNNYKIRLVSTNPAYVGKPPVKNLTINPVGTSPQPQNGERCGPGSVQISAMGGSNLLWFPNAEETIPFAIGRKFTTPFIDQTTPYFVQSGGSTKAKKGISFNLAGTPLMMGDNGLRFTVLSALRLDSITLVHADVQTTDTLCEIQLIKNGIIWYSRTILTSGTKSKIPLYWRMDPGNGYELVCKNIQYAMSTANGNWGNYPLLYPTLLNMEGAISGPADSYPYLFNWVISKYVGCPSPKIEVKAIIKPGQTPEMPSAMQVNDSLLCSLSGNQYQWQVNGQIQTNLPGNKIRGFQNSSYQVRYKLDSCWSEWSLPTVVVITGINSFSVEKEVQFYPNPSKGKIIWVGPNEKTAIRLFSAEGKMIWEKSLISTAEIDLKGMSPGIYLLSWHSEKTHGSGLLSIE